MTDVGYAGLDFGTSNSSIGSGTDDDVFLIEHGGCSTALPSAVFYATEERQTLFGQDAIDAYRLGDEGRLLRAMKSVLGTSLMDAVTHVGRERLRFPDIIGSYVAHLRNALEHRCGERDWSVVVGRPFRFVDDDDAADRAAQSSLESIVREQGFLEVEFQLEPIAAAMAHERTLTREEQVLVVDIGGGTADFSIVRVSPERIDKSDRREDVLATSGVHVGGTDFDRLLSLVSAMPALGHGTREASSGRILPARFWMDLATWHRINTLYTPAVTHELGTLATTAAEPERLHRMLEVVRGRRGHALAAAVESAKIRLSTEQQTGIELELVSETLHMPADRKLFDETVGDAMSRIGNAVDEAMHRAALSASALDTVFMTGGSSSIPVLVDTVRQRVPNARVKHGDAFGSVGLGLVLDARTRFGSCRSAR